jgi:hypothetical protein
MRGLSSALELHVGESDHRWTTSGKSIKIQHCNYMRTDAIAHAVPTEVSVRPYRSGIECAYINK